MTTKPPPSVIPASDKSLEKIAYAAVENIPAADGHERDRLGYNVWRWLAFRKDPLDLAVRSSGSRLGISEEEAIRRIRENLRKHGVENID